MIGPWKGSWRQRLGCAGTCLIAASVGRAEQVALGGDLLAAILDADGRLHVGSELPVEVGRNDGMRRDNGDRGLGGEEFARLRADPDEGLAFGGLVFGAKEDLREEGPKRPVPSDRRADDVWAVRLGLKVVTAHSIVLRMRCWTWRAAPSALLIALPAAEAA